MSSCEKCWRDSHAGDTGDSVTEYHRLMRERHAAPCSPEEQAGPDAGTCQECHRKTLHQHTQEPMCGCETCSPIESR